MSMMNSFLPSIDNVTVFLRIIPLGVDSQGYEGYHFKELSQEHIGKIYKINNTFLAHKERLLSELFQDATKMNEFTFGNNFFRLCIKRLGVFEVGYWECCVDQNLIPKIPSIPLLSPSLQLPVASSEPLPLPPSFIPSSFYPNSNSSNGSDVEKYLVSSDIISLAAIHYNYTFIEALELIYNHITSNITLYPHVIKGKGGYKEELFPIAKKFDNVKINNNFIQQLEKSGAILSPYLLNNSIIFLYKYSYKNKYSQYIEIFFGYFHRHNSVQNTFIAMDISQFNNLDFQLINELDCNTTLQDNIISFNNKFQKQIKFLLLDLPNDIRENKLSVLPSNFPYGIMIKNINYLYQFDFSNLKNHVIFLEIDRSYYRDKKISLSSLERLNDIEKKYHINFYIYYAAMFPEFISEEKMGNFEKGEMVNDIKNFFPYIYNYCPFYCWTLDNFSSSELYKEIVYNDTEGMNQKENQPKSLLSGFSLAKDGFANQKREVKPILSPIINSGQVIWLFAPEKVGKTFMAMSIAYVVSKGNLSVCGWKGDNPKKVLYIDGEMSGVGLKKIYSRIAQGFQDENNEEVLFDSFLFAEADEEYDRILDPTWLEEFQSKLYQYDLIILDSYYSLNNNDRSLKEFFTFLKDLKRHDVSVLVIDHMNRSGELQGSIDKRRFADLGIQLQYGKTKSEIKITYEFDRNGVSSSLDSKKYYKDFSNGAFKFVEIKEEENEDELTREEYIALLEYILHSNFKMKQKELTEFYNKNNKDYDKSYNKRVSEHCKVMKRIIEEKEVLDKYHCGLLQLKHKELIELGKEKCLNMYQEVITNKRQSDITPDEVKADAEK